MRVADPSAFRLSKYRTARTLREQGREQGSGSRTRRAGGGDRGDRLSRYATFPAAWIAADATIPTLTSIATTTIPTTIPKATFPFMLPTTFLQGTIGTPRRHPVGFSLFLFRGFCPPLHGSERACPIPANGCGACSAGCGRLVSGIDASDASLSSGLAYWVPLLGFLSGDSRDPSPYRRIPHYRGGANSFT